MRSRTPLKPFIQSPGSTPTAVFSTAPDSVHAKQRGTRGVRELCGRRHAAGRSTAIRATKQPRMPMPNFPTNSDSQRGEKLYREYRDAFGSDWVRFQEMAKRARAESEGALTPTLDSLRGLSPADGHGLKRQFPDFLERTAGLRGVVPAPAGRACRLPQYFPGAGVRAWRPRVKTKIPSQPSGAFASRLPGSLGGDRISATRSMPPRRGRRLHGWLFRQAYVQTETGPWVDGPRRARSPRAERRGYSPPSSGWRSGPLDHPRGDRRRSPFSLVDYRKGSQSRMGEKVDDGLPRGQKYAVNLCTSMRIKCPSPLQN